MKHILFAIAFGIGALAFVSSEASAWYCRAESSTGSYGWASNGNLRAAKNRALWECARRTPRNRVCYIVYCN